MKTLNLTGFESSVAMLAEGFIDLTLQHKIEFGHLLKADSAAVNIKNALRIVDIVDKSYDADAVMLNGYSVISQYLHILFAKKGYHVVIAYPYEGSVRIEYTSDNIKYVRVTKFDRKINALCFNELVNLINNAE